MKKIDKNIQIKILKIILIIIWMMIVFTFSAQQGIDSGNTSRGFTVTIIRIITGKSLELNDPIVENVQLFVRKAAHFTIYTIGGFLIMNYSYDTKQDWKKKILYSILVGASYAATDELHQFFVPGRGASVFDVGIDTLGVITGVAVYIGLRKCLSIIKNKHR